MILNKILLSRFRSSHIVLLLIGMFCKYERRAALFSGNLDRRNGRNDAGQLLRSRFTTPSRDRNQCLDGYQPRNYNTEKKKNYCRRLPLLAAVEKK